MPCLARHSDGFTQFKTMESFCNAVDISFRFIRTFSRYLTVRRLLLPRRPSLPLRHRMLTALPSETSLSILLRSWTSSFTKTNVPTSPAEKEETLPATVRLKENRTTLAMVDKYSWAWHDSHVKPSYYAFLRYFFLARCRSSSNKTL